MTDHSLQHLRIAITGGTSGLGRGLVRELVDRGARVAFVARHRPDVERTMLDVPTARGIVGDVSRKEDVHPIAIQILGALDGLDVLVNNASSLGPVPLRPLADTACEDLELALATNLVGPFRLTKALLGALAGSARAGGSALVVNISSDAAVTAYENWGAYGASKAALQSPEPHLGCRTGRRRHPRRLDRSRRHGHAAARARGARCRSIHPQTPRDAPRARSPT